MTDKEKDKQTDKQTDIKHTIKQTNRAFLRTWKVIDFNLLKKYGKCIYY